MPWKETLLENSTRLHMNQSALQAIGGVYLSISMLKLNWRDQYYAVRLLSQSPGGLRPPALAASPGVYSSVCSP